MTTSPIPPPHPPFPAATNFCMRRQVLDVNGAWVSRWADERRGPPTLQLHADCCHFHCESKTAAVSMCVKVIESWRVKMRKPERRIYQHTLSALNVLPSETVFLDDLGVNLKPAKELGMRTIKVYKLSSFSISVISDVSTLSSFLLLQKPCFH